MPYLIDSDILIDISRKSHGAIDYIDNLPDVWAISQMTALELIVGARDKKEVNDLDIFLSAFPVIPVNDFIGGRAYSLLKTYSKSHGLHVFDSLIAATAIEEGFTLCSKNKKHFQSIGGLNLEVPPYS